MIKKKLTIGKYNLGVQSVTPRPSPTGREATNEAVKTGTQYATVGAEVGGQIGSIWGPWGQAIGEAVGSTAGGVTGGIIGANRGKRQKLQKNSLRQSDLDTNNLLMRQNLNYGGGNEPNQVQNVMSNKDIMVAEKGMKTAPKALIEVEKNELIFREVKPNHFKLVADFKGGKTHEEGGEPFVAKEGDIIFPGKMRNGVRKMVVNDHVNDPVKFKALRDSLPADNQEKDWTFEKGCAKYSMPKFKKGTNSLKLNMPQYKGGMKGMKMGGGGASGPGGGGGGASAFSGGSSGGGGMGGMMQGMDMSSMMGMFGGGGGGQQQSQPQQPRNPDAEGSAASAASGSAGIGAAWAEIIGSSMGGEEMDTRSIAGNMVSGNMGAAGSGFGMGNSGDAYGNAIRGNDKARIKNFENTTPQQTVNVTNQPQQLNYPPQQQNPQTQYPNVLPNNQQQYPPQYNPNQQQGYPNVINRPNGGATQDPNFMNNRNSAMNPQQFKQGVKSFKIARYEDGNKQLRYNEKGYIVGDGDPPLAKEKDETRKNEIKTFLRRNLTLNNSSSINKNDQQEAIAGLTEERDIEESKTYSSGGPQTQIINKNSPYQQMNPIFNVNGTMNPNFDYNAWQQNNNKFFETQDGDIIQYQKQGEKEKINKPEKLRLGRRSYKVDDGGPEGGGGNTTQHQEQNNGGPQGGKKIGGGITGKKTTILTTKGSEPDKKPSPDQSPVPLTEDWYRRQAIKLNPENPDHAYNYLLNNSRGGQGYVPPTKEVIEEPGTSYEYEKTWGGGASGPQTEIYNRNEPKQQMNPIFNINNSSESKTQPQTPQQAGIAAATSAADRDRDLRDREASLGGPQQFLAGQYNLTPRDQQAAIFNPQALHLDQNRYRDQSDSTRGEAERQRRIMVNQSRNLGSGGSLSNMQNASAQAFSQNQQINQYEGQRADQINQGNTGIRNSEAQYNNQLFNAANETNISELIDTANKNEQNRYNVDNANFGALQNSLRGAGQKYQYDKFQKQTLAKNEAERQQRDTIEQNAYGASLLQTNPNMTQEQWNNAMQVGGPNSRYSVGSYDTFKSMNPQKNRDGNGGVKVNEGVEYKIGTKGLRFRKLIY